MKSILDSDDSAFLRLKDCGNWIVLEIGAITDCEMKNIATIEIGYARAAELLSELAAILDKRKRT